jgi:hypothetical protein
VVAARGAQIKGGDLMASLRRCSLYNIGQGRRSKRFTIRCRPAINGED